jgi:hypothetical protein
MFLDRSTDPGELTVTFDRDAYLRLLRRAGEHGLTPEAFVERIARETYGHAILPSRIDDPEPTP